MEQEATSYAGTTTEVHDTQKEATSLLMDLIHELLSPLMARWLAQRHELTLEMVRAERFRTRALRTVKRTERH